MEHTKVEKLVNVCKNNMKSQIKRKKILPLTLSSYLEELVRVDSVKNDRIKIRPSLSTIFFFLIFFFYGK